MKRALTNLEHALLGLVHQAPVSGYDLCKTFETTPIGHYSASPGSIYPALKRLETRGMLAGAVEHAGSMKPRRVFSITPAGKEELQDWVSLPVTRADVTWRSDELLLRFGFMGGLVRRDRVLRFLGELASEAAAVASDLRKHHRSMPGGTKKSIATGRMALGYGIESYRLLARWARQSIRDIESES